MYQLVNLTNFSERFMSGYLQILLYTMMGTFLGHFGAATFLHWMYYKNQRCSAISWKCQPNKWISLQLELKGTFLASITILWASVIWAAVATYIWNGGEASKVYFHHTDAGYVWLLLQIPIVFITLDYMFYWVHRLYHVPWMYKRFHKIHHAYKQPTAFVAVAFHPIEHLTEILITISPVFLVPLYWVNLLSIYIYMFIHGIISHSGVNLSTMWWQPWQPDAKYHDLHHQYSYGNYAFFISIWDNLHGTSIKEANTKSSSKNKYSNNKR